MTSIIINTKSQFNWCFSASFVNCLDTKRTFVAPMIRDSKPLKAKVHDVKAKDSGNTILQKSFPGGMLTLTGSNSASALASTCLLYTSGVRGASQYLRPRCVAVVASVRPRAASFLCAGVGACLGVPGRLGGRPAGRGGGPWVTGRGLALCGGRGAWLSQC